MLEKLRVAHAAACSNMDLDFRALQRLRAGASTPPFIHPEIECVDIAFLLVLVVPRDLNVTAFACPVMIPAWSSLFSNSSSAFVAAPSARVEPVSYSRASRMHMHTCSAQLCARRARMFVPG